MITLAGERAAAGAKFLDEKSPGWAAAIDIDILDISHGENCILGQLYGGFSKGMDAFADEVHVGCECCAVPGSLSAHDLGFYVGYNLSRVGEEYRELTAEWKDQILIRRVAHGLSSLDEAATKDELVLTA